MFSSATVIADAVVQDPIFSFYFLGGNSLAMFSGGTGKDQTGKMQILRLGIKRITDPNFFCKIMPIGLLL
ncbi:hypothetical protein ACFFWB_27070 [Flavobacterium procerum]|uniref:hypothetical protein n=1 Tax=Flavobacterium procerum TaxID=1455569 RepID=UPI0035E9C315